ncbi:hypothetical protein [Loktanella sp. M215]|uniref:hypothetical protein n=1 Tax=Loktanella sp. M215 TaxID=2675431 RepID=UPI001F175E16|nr:hypothetical protein [Loktanella sp. M215]MCF7700560.1 hypothetical protein [Loktanella sp. M215]
MADPLIFLRDFNRYTGDGKPNAPIGAPLPIGDPASGAYVPTKKDLRDFVSALAIQVSDEALVLTKTGNFAGLTNLTAARANLGLGSAATFATESLPVSTPQATATASAIDTLFTLLKTLGIGAGPTNDPNILIAFTDEAQQRTWLEVDTSTLGPSALAVLRIISAIGKDPANAKALRDAIGLGGVAVTYDDPNLEVLPFPWTGSGAF